MENLIGGEAGGTHSRANLLIEPVRIFTNNDKDKTDILVEIFVPQEKFADFISLAREVMRNQSDSLLNVTIREISQDEGHGSTLCQKRYVWISNAFHD